MQMVTTLPCTTLRDNTILRGSFVEMAYSCTWTLPHCVPQYIILVLLKRFPLFMCMSILPMCMYVYHMHVCRRGFWMLWDWGFGQSYTIMWVLGTKSRSSVRAASAFNSQAISLDHHPWFLTTFCQWTIVRSSKNAFSFLNVSKEWIVSLLTENF